MLAGLAVSIYAAATAAPPGGVSGTVLDALTGRPVRGAVVSDGKKAVALTDSTGQFQLRDLADGAVDVIVEHPEYIIFARPAVPVGNRVVIRLQPASIKAEPVEIVETREEELRPMLRAQAPFKFPIEFEFLNRGKQLKGVYRVCVGKDGHISLVAALDPAGAADPYVKEGIAQGWEYKPLSKPACFFWRVTLNFNYNATIMKPPARIEQSVPRGPEIQRK